MVRKKGGKVDFATWLLIGLALIMAILAFSRLPLEVAIVGLKVTTIRLASTLDFPLVAGLIARYLFG